MNSQYRFGSVTRIAALDREPFAVTPCPREAWRTGDYVVGEVLPGAARVYPWEEPDGRMSEVSPGQQVVGALGARCATLELVGEWQAVGDDLQLDALTAAGVLGRLTSRSVTSPLPMPLHYLGHVVGETGPIRMADRAPQPRAERFASPVIQVVGTSMECGKTAAAKAAIALLKRRGLRVAGAKLTGVGRYRDILGMRDAGADAVFDFMDVGLPSTLEPPAVYAMAAERLLRLIADAAPDVVVIEVGASPMEPYNGEVAMALLRPHVRLTLLAATEPYAVLGAREHLAVRPDLVVGRVASTSAGVAIVERLTGVPALNPLDPAAHPALDALLARALPAPVLGAECWALSAEC